MNILFNLVLATLLLVAPSLAFAGCTYNTVGTTSTITASCSFDNTVDGFDSGSGLENTSELRISGGTLTIGGNQAIAVGKLTLTGGAIAIIDGGKLLLNRVLWYTDADNDGYATTALPKSDALPGPLTPTPTGFKRKVAFTPSGTDCNDLESAVKISHAQCYTDADGDSYTNGLAANTTCLSHSTCALSTSASASTHGAAVTAYTAGRLKDAATTNDCGDNSTNAYPGQATYFSTPFLNNSGVSQYDYDCSASGTAAGETKDPSQPLYVCNVTGCASHYFTISAGFTTATACGATGTWKTYAGAGGAACTINIAGAGTTCPAGTTSSVVQKCK